MDATLPRAAIVSLHSLRGRGDNSQRLPGRNCRPVSSARAVRRANPRAARNISETRRSGRNQMEALELASWPQLEKGRQSVMSTFEPRFGGAHFMCAMRAIAATRPAADRRRP
jgi:hypothetical protein